MDWFFKKDVKTGKARIIWWISIPFLYLAGVTLLYFFVLKKELVLYPFSEKNKIVVNTFYDGKDGGATELVKFDTLDILKFRYILRPSDWNLYAGVSVVSPGQPVLLPNFKYDTIAIKLRGENIDAVKLQVKVIHEGITEKEEQNSFRYCSVFLPVETYYREFRIKLNDLETEPWWLRDHNIKRGTRLPIKSKKIAAVQIADSGGQAFDKELEFSIARLSLERNPVFIYIALVGGGFFIYLILLMFFLIQRSRQTLSTRMLIKSTLQADSFREMTFLLKEVNAHKEGENLLDSLIPAQGIQRSILPSEQVLTDSVKSFFIIWKPRDIVGGDFYWFKKVQDGYLLAEIDCAGHGIPGAFMTMMVHSILERVAEHGDSSSPAMMLRRLNRILKKSRNYGNSDQIPMSGDGFDISLCFVKNSEKQLIFAGARQALFYARQGHINMCWGDRTSVGTGSTSMDYRFTDHVINLSPGDTVYLTSDGYLDQDEKAKKLPLGKKRFIQLLTRIMDEPMEEQQRFLESFLTENLKGTGQIDDITLIGFKPF